MTSYKHGLVIGKFMPFHKGHEYLVRFANYNCEQLTVIVDCFKGQQLSPAIRAKWIKEQFPNVNVISLEKEMPQDPIETPDFWNIWVTELKKHVPNVDLLCASMEYGYQLSQELHCAFKPLDFERSSINISATQIKTDPFKYWDFLSDSTKEYYVKKICFIGPESTGKSTIGQKLANHFNTVYVPEYAKTVIAGQNGDFFEQNVEDCAISQIQTEKALARISNKIMFCDSCALTTIAWCKVLFPNFQIPQSLLKIASTQKYEKTFLFYPDTTFVPDVHRQFKNSSSHPFRMQMFESMRQLLLQFERPFECVHGPFEQKEQSIKESIQNKILDMPYTTVEKNIYQKTKTQIY